MPLRPMTRAMGLIAGLLTAAGPSLSAQEAEAPLSAIDWLSRSVVPLPGSVDATFFEPPAVTSAALPDVTVQPLDGPSPDAVGILTSAITGLPSSLWAASNESTLTNLVAAERVETLPAVQRLLITLMLAEADPPIGAGPEGLLFLARVDKLLDIGAITEAQSLVEAADTDEPAAFRRWFDVALLTGSEARACAQMRRTPDIAPTYMSRIFCVARGGDWLAAALILNTGVALGDIGLEDEALLSRFLDPDLFEGLPPLPPPSRISPLVFRMREAIGESLATATLPRAFAHADLRETAGWRNQIEAAERLARSGVLSPNVLQALYMARTPAASGGVWDRAAAFQRFDRAIKISDPILVAAALPDVWSQMQDARLETAFAELYADDLTRIAPAGDSAATVLRIRLLSPSYEAAAIGRTGETPQEAFLLGLARGTPPAPPSGSPQFAAVADGFTRAPPEELVGLIDEDRLGEALLHAISRFDSGVTGDFGALSEALATFRAVGLEDLARRAALQYLLLERVS